MYKDVYVWKKISIICRYTLLAIPTIPILFNFFMSLKSFVSYSKEKDFYQYGRGLLLSFG